MMASSASSYSVRRYEPALKPCWDAFVRASKNGTFLFLRDYMEYHRDRFRDQSLLVLRRRSSSSRSCPAIATERSCTATPGLTYGGFVVSEAMTTPIMLDIFDQVLAYVASRRHPPPSLQDRAQHLSPDSGRGGSLRPVPARRHALPPRRAERRRACRTALPVATRRHRGAAKAEKAGVVAAASDDWRGYWSVLAECLEGKFGVDARAQPGRDRAAARACSPTTSSSTRRPLPAKCSPAWSSMKAFAVAHVQYIAVLGAGARSSGRSTGCSSSCSTRCSPHKPFFDLGISNEQEGKVLNLGLIQQKEGFGARAVVHDFYSLDL